MSKTLLKAFALVTLLAISVAFTGCAPAVQPLPSGFETPTSAARPTPVPIEDEPTAVILFTPTPAPTAVPNNGMVRFGEWPDNRVQLADAIVAYITVHGFNYVVEFVSLQQSTAHDALLKGDVDILTHFDRAAAADWYNENTRNGAIVDLGSIYESQPDIRIVVSAKFKDRAPDLVEFASRVKPGDVVFAELAAGISTGRIGITPVVAALTFFKNNDPLWPAWVPANVEEGVRLAISKGVNSFQRCIVLPNGRCAQNRPIGS